MHSSHVLQFFCAVSHSSVGLPVGAFRSRMQRLAGEFERTKLPPLRAAGASDKEILSAAMMYLYEEQRFAPPAFGRTNLPLTATVDNPGVWENPRYVTPRLPFGSAYIPYNLVIMMPVL